MSGLILHHRSQQGKASQSNPELTDVAGLASQLALGIRVSAF